MREIIHIQIGECGNLIGNAFWSQIGKEHLILYNGKFDGNEEEKSSQLLLNQINTYYHNDTKRYIPRACLIDSDPTLLDVIKASSIGSLFKPDDLCLGTGGCQGSWIRGHYDEGAELVDEVMDIIRKNSECCDCMQGFQLTHSISSGTGGGVGSLILRKIRDEYFDSIIATFSVFPSVKVSDATMEPFNATMSIDQLLLHSDLTYVVDNNALYNITHNVLKQEKPEYSDMNWLVSLMLSGITAPFRFECNENNTMRKIGINLVPFPRLHFLLCSQAPLYQSAEQNEPKLSVEEITNQIWSTQNFFADVQPEDGKYLSSMCCYRGSTALSYTLNMDDITHYSRSIDPTFFMNGFLRNNKIYQHIPSAIINLCSKYIPYNICVKQEDFVQSMYEYEYQICKKKNKMICKNTQLDELVAWMPNNITSICVQNMGLSNSGTMIANITSLKNVFQRISSQFASYKGTLTGFIRRQRYAGMDEFEFQEADKNVRDLITEYQDKQDFIYSQYGCVCMYGCDTNEEE